MGGHNNDNNTYEFVGFDNAENTETFNDGTKSVRFPISSRIKLKFHDVVDFNLILILWSRFFSLLIKEGASSYISLSLAVSSTLAYFMKILRRNIPERYHDKFRFFYLCSGAYIFVCENITQMFFPTIYNASELFNSTIWPPVPNVTLSANSTQ